MKRSPLPVPLLLLTVTMLTGACAFPRPVTPCTSRSDCPSGYVCVGDTFAAAQSVSERRSSIGSDRNKVCVPSDVLRADCGGPGVYRDDFDTADFEQTWLWCGNEHRVEGNLSYALEDISVSGVRGGGCWTLNAMDLRWNQTHVSVVQPPSSDLSGTADFTIDNGRYWLGYRLRRGKLLAVSRLDDNAKEQVHYETPFDLAQHQHLQLRDEDGEMLFETSPDRTGWQTVHSMSSPDWLGRTHIHLGGHAEDQSSVGTEVRWDDLNAELEPQDWCTAAAIKDDFEDGLLEQWRIDPEYRDRGHCSLDASGGRLHINYLGGTPADGAVCNAIAHQGFDLAGSEVLVQVTPSTETGFLAGLAVWNITGPWLSWAMGDGILHAVSTPPDGESGHYLEPVSTPAGDYRWLRLRQEDGWTYFEARVDRNSDWDEIHRDNVIPEFRSSMVEMVFWQRDDEAPGLMPATSASFDNLNLP